jgi:hypothetical protein
VPTVVKENTMKKSNEEINEHHLEDLMAKLHADAMKITRMKEIPLGTGTGENEALKEIARGTLRVEQLIAMLERYEEGTPVLFHDNHGSIYAVHETNCEEILGVDVICISPVL